jgi:predicted esterase
MADLAFVHRFVQGTGGATLLVLHGTGGNEDDLLPLAADVAPSASLLSPRGQVLENGMPRFFRRLAIGVFDEEDVIARATDLATFTAAAAEAYGIDATRIYALGYSNGANIAAALLLLHPKALAGAALLRAVPPLAQPPTPDLAHRPVLISAGSRDPVVPRSRVEALAACLTRAGARVDLEWHDAGHELHADEIHGVRRWASAHVM